MKIKICGLRREADIEAVNRAMPDYIGYVLAPSKRQVTQEQVKKLNLRLDAAIRKTGVFVNHDREEIAGLLLDGTLDAAQLHGNESVEDILWLKKETGKTIIKAISMSSLPDWEGWNSSPADYLLLDNGAGGTGKCFDWDLISSCKKPFFLAGGLNSDNLKEALKTDAYALDVSGGVETDGKKDPQKIWDIVHMVRNNRGIPKNGKY